MSTIVFPLIAYLFGSLSSAIIVCKAMGLADPRLSGSKNPGATNVLRLGGKKAAAITLFGDAFKGWLPIFVANIMSDDSMVIALVGACVFLGHLYPVFFSFKGGKGVATAAGVFAGLSITLLVLLLLIWFLTVLISRYSSLAGLLTAAAAPWLNLWLLSQPNYFVMSLMIFALLFWRHRENIKRLLNGQESKIRFAMGGKK